MRKLKTTDVAEFCRCLKAIGIKDEIKDIAKKSNNLKDAWDKGFDLIYNIFDRATEKSAEVYLYAFLAGPFEMTAEEVADLDLDRLFALCKQFAEENNLINFFNIVQKAI